MCFIGNKNRVKRRAVAKATPGMDRRQSGNLMPFRQHYKLGMMYQKILVMPLSNGSIADYADTHIAYLLNRSIRAAIARLCLKRNSASTQSSEVSKSTERHFGQITALVFFVITRLCLSSAAVLII